MGLFNVLNKNLSFEEIKFLKYINNKDIDVNFSPRWECVNGITPKNTLSKLLIHKYIVVKDKKYVLTSKGTGFLDKNKEVFMSERDKALPIFHDLTNNEYIQLKVFNKLEKYAELKNGNLSYDKGYTKYDILWSIYNSVILENATKDFGLCSIAYRRMSEQVYKEKKYKYALELLIVSLYYHIREFYDYDINLYERHIKKLHPILTKYINSCQLYFSNIDELSTYFNNAIKRYLPNKQSKIINLLINNYWEDYND